MRKPDFKEQLEARKKVTAEMLDRMEVKVQSSASEMNKFINESRVWKDILNQINARLGIAYSGYSACTTLLEFGKLNGVVEALQEVAHIPAMILEGLIIAEKEELKKQQAEEGDNDEG